MKPGGGQSPEDKESLAGGKTRRTLEERATQKQLPSDTNRRELPGADLAASCCGVCVGRAAWRVSCALCALCGCALLRSRSGVGVPPC